jgi:hypothetical protein
MLRALCLQFDGDYLKGLVTQIFRKVYERVERRDLGLRLDVLRPAIRRRVPPATRPFTLPIPLDADGSEGSHFLPKPRVRSSSNALNEH